MAFTPPALDNRPLAIPNAPRDWYDQLQAVNSSLLKAVHGKTALHGWLSCMDPERESEDRAEFRIGTLLHMALLEPEEFARVRHSDLGAQTKAYKEAKAEAQAEGVMFVAESEYSKAQKLADAVLRHSAIAHLFRSSDPDEQALLQSLNELTLTWIDPVMNLRCKARLDAVRFIRSTLYTLDLKTAADASSEEFGKAAARYGYVMQGAFYTDALFHCKASVAPLLGLREHHLIGVPQEFEFIVLEKPTPCPGMVARYFMEPRHFEIGRHLNRKAMEVVAGAMATDYWPGYSTAAQPLTLPPWYKP